MLYIEHGGTQALKVIHWKLCPASAHLHAALSAQLCGVCQIMDARIKCLGLQEASNAMSLWLPLTLVLAASHSHLLLLPVLFSIFYFKCLSNGDSTIAVLQTEYIMYIMLYISTLIYSDTAEHTWQNYPK